MRNLRIAALSTLALVAALPASRLQAQDGTLAFTYWITVRPGSAPGFEAAWKEHLAFRRANGDSWTWGVLQQQFGDESGSYVIRSAGHTWADMDAAMASPRQAQLQAHLGATVTPLVESVRSGITQVDLAVSVPPEAGTTVNVAPVTNFRIRPSATAAFDAGLAAVREATMATGYPFRYVVLRRIWGGPGFTVAVAGQAPNFAALASGDGLEQMLVSHFGPARAQEIFQPMFEAIEASESSIFVVRTDLSSPQ
jgi:hypothetical protein